MKGQLPTLVRDPWSTSTAVLKNAISRKLLLVDDVLQYAYALLLHTLSTLGNFTAMQPEYWPTAQRGRPRANVNGPGGRGDCPDGRVPLDCDGCHAGRAPDSTASAGGGAR
jgi:hypothetical protein